MTIAPDNTKKKPSYVFVCGADARFGVGCGRELTLHDNFKNRDGTKKVPLEFSYDSVGQIHLEPHKCPAKEEARRSQQEKLAKDVEDIKREVSDIKGEMANLSFKMDELMNHFTPNPPQPASEM